MSTPSLSTALWETAVAIGEMGAAAAVSANALLADHPPARTLLITVLTAFLLYWFIDGVWNERRKCLPCRGRGSFTSKLSSRLDRSCKCCGGTGRHLTVRKRLVQRLRRNGT